MRPATFSLGVLRRGGRGINRLCRDQLVNNLDIRHVNKILPRNCKFTVYFIIIILVPFALDSVPWVSLTRRIVPCSEVMLLFSLPD